MELLIDKERYAYEGLFDYGKNFFLPKIFFGKLIYENMMSEKIIWYIWLIIEKWYRGENGMDNMCSNLFSYPNQYGYR